VRVFKKSAVELVRAKASGRKDSPSARTWRAIGPPEGATGELSRSDYPIEPMDLANMRAYSVSPFTTHLVASVSHP
jgi:hypothetical protein